MTQTDIVSALIDSQGRLYSEDMGANIARDTPQELFHWLIGALMLAARIDARHAVEAAKALRGAGLHKIDAIRSGERRALVKVLNENGYARFDESTADYIRAAAELVGDRYGGDLRRLRDGAADVDAALAALQEVKGIGPLGAAIFAREAQVAWDIFHPRADGPALKAAARLGLPTDAEALAALAPGRDRFARLMAALTRAALDGPSKEVVAAAEE